VPGVSGFQLGDSLLFSMSTRQATVTRAGGQEPTVSLKVNVADLKATGIRY